MKRPSRREIIGWAGLSVILGLAAIEGRRVDSDPLWVGKIELGALVLAVAALIKSRRSRESWLASLRRSIFDAAGFVGLMAAFTALSMRFGKALPPTFEEWPLDLVGWLLLAILMVVVVVQLARLLDLGPFGPRPVGRRG